MAEYQVLGEGPTSLPTMDLFLCVDLSGLPMRREREKTNRVYLHAYALIGMRSACIPLLDGRR